ncbi:MAG: peptidase [Clostridiales bacterium]|nr:peptidase [Candidatus Cacconaster stercorequi]
MAGYYYQQLNREQRGAYEAMRAGFDRLQPAIRVPRLEGRELSEVYQRLKLDEPLLFFVVGFTYRFYPGADHVELLPEYLFDKGRIKSHRQAIDTRIARLTRPLQGKSDADKERAIHDFILENVRYDKLKKSYSHEIIGPLTQGVGVCEGIAKTVKVLCDAVHIPCIVALSEANPDAGVKYRHAWNVVSVDGKYYHLDATFDNSLQRGEKRYDYYNLDDRHIFRDHEKLVLPVPECTADKGYFYRKLSFTKPEDVENRVRQALRKKQPRFVFHWRGGGLNREILGELWRCADRLAAEKGKSAACSVNMAQSVIQFDFADSAAAAVTIQQPDEGREEENSSATALQAAKNQI